MSEIEPAVTPRPNRSFNRLSVLASSRRSKMFGVAEIVALSISCLIFLLVLFSYLYFAVPARLRRENLRSDRTQLENNLKKSETIVNKGQGSNKPWTRFLKVSNGLKQQD